MCVYIAYECVFINTFINFTLLNSFYLLYNKYCCEKKKIYRSLDLIGM